MKKSSFKSIVLGGLQAIAFLGTLFVVGPAGAMAATGRPAVEGILKNSLEATIRGDNVYIFNGIPTGWGEDLIQPAVAGMDDARTLNGLGGLPFICIYNESDGVAFFNTSLYQEPFHARVTSDGNSATLQVSGGNSIERYDFTGDYYEPLREFAVRMQGKGISSRPAPDWAFDAVWETYGYEENFDGDTIRTIIPVLKQLGIKTITIDAGWYGQGRGDEWESDTGDFKVNPDTVGTEQDFIGLISELHREDFRVRLWWVPGVAERGTDLEEEHPEWFYSNVVSGTGDTEDVYLDPTNPEVVAWTRTLVTRFIGYGVDGFKQDDVYQITPGGPADQQAYSGLFEDIYLTALDLKPDFVINTCNCGLSQNMYDFPGENQLITSDPVGSKQFRRRAKYLHALNVNRSAILGDHIELTLGDVGPEDLTAPGFYDRVDFSSVVPLGMVLETKFRSDPGDHYRTWFEIYRTYRFYEMEWVNIPYFGGIETYLMKRGEDLYFSFFTPETDGVYSGSVTLSHLTPGRSYTVRELVGGTFITSFTPSGTARAVEVSFVSSLLLAVAPTSPVPADSSDFNGDGTADLAIFRPSSGLWAIREISRVYFGTSTDLPVAGDYNGDGTAGIGVFRSASGLWALRGVSRIYFGTAGDTVAPGDYDGDATCDVGIFRPATGLWALRGITRIYFGGNADSPVPGDYNGDGTKDVGVFRAGTGLWALRNSSRIYFGGHGDRAVPGDYDGAGTWEPAIFRSTTGLWAIRGVSRIFFGRTSDLSVPADYDEGSGIDIGIFRDASGLWAIRDVSRFYFGSAGDTPVTR